MALSLVFVEPLVPRALRPVGVTLSPSVFSHEYVQGSHSPSGQDWFFLLYRISRWRASLIKGVGPK